MQSKIQVGLIGFGNVGKGVFEILKQNQEAISDRVGHQIELKTVVVRNLSRYTDVELGNIQLSTDPKTILEDDAIQIVIEVIGGENPAYDFICKALKAKKHVVTANKEVIAKHKAYLFSLAKKNGVDIYFEASVAGSIPIIRSFKVGYAANQITDFYGILNGTTNYILTQMLEKKVSFDQALVQAQEAGFAEADPSGDVSGLDAAYKLIILAYVAFKVDAKIEDLSYEGIEKITLKNLQYAEEMGFSIRLLACAGFEKKSKALRLKVCPLLVPSDHPLAQVKNEFNAIFSIGNAMGESMIYGRGAGSLPTGSAVVSDLLDIAFDIHQESCGRRNLEVSAQCLPIQNSSDSKQAYYIQLSVKDETGVLEKVVHIFSESKISIDKVRQKTQEKGIAELLFITHPISGKNLDATVERLKALDCVHHLDQVLGVLTNKT